MQGKEGERAGGDGRARRSVSAGWMDYLKLKLEKF